MHNFSKYNTTYGWNEGDKFLSKFAEYLSATFPNAQIFRIYGDDFVLINTEHLEIDMKQFDKMEILVKHKIIITKRHIDLRETDVIDLESLEGELKF